MTTVETSTDQGITTELAAGKFTDEMLQKMRDLIGAELRTDSCVNNEYATRLAILRFCEGIGDDNPLWTDEEYGAAGPFGEIIAPPSFIFACLGSIQVGWPGLGGFHAETRMKFERPIKVGDKITAKVIFDGFDGPTDSNFGGKRIKDYLRQEYWNQDGELAATFVCSRMRFERGEMQNRRESRKIELPHPWTPEQLEQIEANILAEQPRGATPRYWEDVEIGDELDTVTKGPLGLTDEIAYIAAGAAPVPRLTAHGVALRKYRKHPKWAYRDPNTHALEPVYSVHYNDYAARLQGAQIAYDVGIQRTCWGIHCLTNWMGDTGFLKSLHGQYRSHVYLSDVVVLGGTVVAKEIDEDGDHIVKIETRAVNQRDQNVMPGSAVVVLPTRGSDVEVQDIVWGGDVAVEEVRGILFKIYTDRPRHIGDLLAFACRWGDRAHIVQGDRVVTFADLQRAAHAKAAALADGGVQPGDRVLLLGWNSPEWIINFWACALIGAVPVLGNGWWSDGEVADAIDTAKVTVALADQRGATKLPQAFPTGVWECEIPTEGVAFVSPERASEDSPAVIVFTSGTSGKPKAVVLAHRSLLAGLQMLLHITRRFPQMVDESTGDAGLHTGPMFHIGGVQTLLRAIMVGDTLVMPTGSFKPEEALRLIEEWKIARWSAVPTMIARVLEHPDAQIRDLTTLKSVTVGGAPIHAEFVELLRKGLPGVEPRVATGYGLTENGGQATAASGRDTIERPGSCGRPLPCVEVKIDGATEHVDGEILLRSPTQMLYYYGEQSSPITSDGWLHTGDLGRIDDDGYVYITGRAKDMIIRGGENIAPAAVEAALAKLPSVVESVVFGVPHPDLGEEVMAAVFVSDATTAEQLTAHMRSTIASFAVPTRWQIETEPLPTNHAGKIDKPAIAAAARAKLVGESR